jgi:hypothetical protein
MRRDFGGKTPLTKRTRRKCTENVRMTKENKNEFIASAVEYPALAAKNVRE